MRSRSELRGLASARKRPEAFLLGELDRGLRNRLLEFYDQHKQANILQASIDNRLQRVQDVGNKDYLLDAYAQIELQELATGATGGDLKEYTKSKSPTLMREISKYVGRCYRSRISTLRPGGCIPRHIDDPNQIRVLALLRGRQVFTVYGKDKETNIPMLIGQLWFVNTAWEHKVENTASIDRVALLLNLFELPNSFNV